MIEDKEERIKELKRLEKQFFLCMQLSAKVTKNIKCWYIDFNVMNWICIPVNQKTIDVGIFNLMVDNGFSTRFVKEVDL